MAKVNIIIRAFNRLEYTVMTIREIDRLAGYDDYKIIVIDQASTDGTGQWLKSLVKEGYYKIKPIFLTENAGDFGGTRIGYENLDPDCEYAMQWDNDCVPITSNFLHHIVKIMDTFPKIGQLMLKRTGVGNVIYPRNVVDFEGIWFGDVDTVTCVNIQRRKVVDDINYWVVDESTFWDFQINRMVQQRGYELKKVENVIVFHNDCYPEPTKISQGLKYPLYFKSRVNGKINYNALNYSE